jgi:hypothetical protein
MISRTEMLEALSKRFADEGKLIEAGWIGLQLAAVPPDAPQLQINEMRMAFMAGAQHLFASILTILDPGAEPSDADMRRMDLISKELEAFRNELELRVSRAQGSG